MYKVLLVDDESIIVQGLSRIVPWEQYGCVVAGTAEDGEQGIDLIRRLEPHILFTDIRMPGIDGLSMIAGIKSEFPELQITVLTGYRDFAYAQQAIRLGVTRFLLKPSKMDELTEALECMTGKLREGGITGSPAVVQDASPGEAAGEQAAANVCGTDAAGSFIVRQAVAFIEEHCAQKLSLGEVADQCYVSQWHLSKLLSRCAQQSFYDILNHARVERAKQMMQDPALRISEIAELVGYVDTAHFSRVFKKLEGVSANEYRNRRV